MLNNIEHKYNVVFIIFIIAVLGYIALIVSGATSMVDERVHFAQIKLFLKGSFLHHPKLTTIPGYHAVIASILYPLNLNKLEYARLFSLLIGLLSVFVFYCCACKTIPDRAYQRTLGYFLLPIFFPYLFLVYTHSLSMLLILSGINSYLNKRRVLAALFLGLSVLVRQTNIIWVCMIMAMTYVDEYKFQLSFDRLTHHIKDNSLFVLIGIGFLLFVFLNGGVAIGDGDKHPITMRTENIFFSLFIFFILFLPFIISKSKPMYKVLREKFLLSAIIFFGCGLIYFNFFNVTHTYNTYDGFLHNIILRYLTHDMYSRLLFFLFMTLAMLSISVFSLGRQSQYLLYPFWILSLLPLCLIEHRYYIPIMAMFLLFKKAEQERAEWLLVFYFLMLSGVICFFMMLRIFP